MKKISNLTTEELEKLARQEDQEEFKSSKKEHRSVLNFIRDYNIVAGDVRVASSVLFYLYMRKFNRHNIYDKVGRVSFFHTFAQHFKQVKSNGKRYYMVNDFVEVTPELFEAAERYKRRLNEQKKKS
jgi:hypothetical protein